MAAPARCGEDGDGKGGSRDSTEARGVTELPRGVMAVMEVRDEAVVEPAVDAVDIVHERVACRPALSTASIAVAAPDANDTERAAVALAAGRTAGC